MWQKMAKRKFNQVSKTQKIMAILRNSADDIISSKKSPEVLGVILRDIALALAVSESEFDDDIEIARLWIEWEEKLVKGRANNHGYRQLALGDESNVPGGKIGE